MWVEKMFMLGSGGGAKAPKASPAGSASAVISELESYVVETRMFRDTNMMLKGNMTFVCADSASAISFPTILSCPGVQTVSTSAPFWCSVVIVSRILVVISL